MIIDDMIHGGFAPDRARRIEQETPVVPRAIAEAVCEEAGAWLQQPLPRRWVRELIAHANTVYDHDARFRRKVSAKGDAGRDWLWMFMRHWFGALLKNRRPQLFDRLPASFSIGCGLPGRLPSRNYSVGIQRKGAKAQRNKAETADDIR